MKHLRYFHACFFDNILQLETDVWFCCRKITGMYFGISWVQTNVQTGNVSLSITVDAVLRVICIVGS